LAVEALPREVFFVRILRLVLFAYAEGAFVRKWGSVGGGDGQFRCPDGLAVDAEHVYVSDYENDRIQVFCKADGAFVRKWGSAGGGDGQFLDPSYLAVDAEHVYVSDPGNRRIQVFS
jgi:DNA-binding beta-propeller fold protein YncE